eukprot:2437314-Rhodomonas_salina.4
MNSRFTGSAVLVRLDSSFAAPVSTVAKNRRCSIQVRQQPTRFCSVVLGVTSSGGAICMRVRMCVRACVRACVRVRAVDAVLCVAIDALSAAAVITQHRPGVLRVPVSLPVLVVLCFTAFRPILVFKFIEILPHHTNNDLNSPV